MKNCGIYKIENITTKKVYIGSSKEINKRLKRHIFDLNRNRHYNEYLQNSINKYGIHNHSFTVIEYCEDNSDFYLTSRESYYVDYYKSCDPDFGFNLVIPNRNSENNCNPNYINKLSIAKKGIVPKNIDILREKQKRPILEYENDILIKEYGSCKEAGEFLDIDYKLINNVLTKKVKSLRKYPNKTWKYKDNLEVRKIKTSINRSWNKGSFKKILQKDLNGRLIKTFASAKTASIELNVNQKYIMSICRKEYNYCKKLNCVFEYENETILGI